ncbi:hypothetical protein ASG72_04705 [Bosea sp. Leaf344]|uniref:glycine zipper domain-containing protein n=1 Tax=Bosea sp. Leaf344 TaxID=1736346 RepID=UPI0006F9160B|nr:hypothetical protein [Bosea sp. Leaf344]KQU54909.1 hypothetical protein ASG72_04705 [Bosea sp. Leaf344]
MANTNPSSNKSETGSSFERAKDEIGSAAETAANKARQAGEEVKRHAGDIEASLTRGAEEVAAGVNATLRSVGVDTDRLGDVAREQVGDLQRMIMQEVQERPMRALGLAAAVGLFVGFLASR